MASARLLTFIIACLTHVQALIDGPWSDRSLPPEGRAKALMKNMTLDEKLSLLHGPEKPHSTSESYYTGFVKGVQRLEMPNINMEDGPQGFRDLNTTAPPSSTAFPSGLTMAATWDADAMRLWGSSMGKEFYGKGANVQLGPGLCIARVPRNGRNFEYLSGEDPFLGYTLVKPVIEGIQSQKVVANAKHWVLNNQETNRHEVSVEIDERTEFEIYYPPFLGAIEAGVGSFMCGYNKINKTGEGGLWSCENPKTLGDLKERLGFKGYVMSDWGATHSASIMAGLDMEMPRQKFMNADNIKALLHAGNATRAAINDAVTRILWSMFSVGVMDEPLSAWNYSKRDNNVTTEASVAVARRLAAKATVLLKNEDAVLPLPQGKKLAVIGFASENAVTHGGGSGHVLPSYTSTPLAGISAAAGRGAQVEFNNGTDLAAAARLAASSDYAVVFVGTLSHEGVDRDSLSLDDGCIVDVVKMGHQCEGNSKNQNAMIEAIANANPKTIVVASVPGAILMPWSGNVKAILTNFMPGQQAGNAIADVLFGTVNPSGKLPITFPNKENEINFNQEQWPGLPAGNKPTVVNYSEKLLVGYRYYEALAINFTTGFPFGHGLSYTQFEYSGLAVDKHSAKVSFVVANKGKVAGAEVAQLYLEFPSSAGEPPFQLKGFKKTAVLAPGAQERIEIDLTPKDLSTWNPSTHSWSAVTGIFRVYVGSSSRDIRLKGALALESALFV